MTNQNKVQKAPMTPKQRRRTLVRLCRYMFRYPGLVALAFFLMISANVLALAGPKLSGLAIDAIVGPGQVDFPRVFLFCGLMIAFYILSGVMSYLLSIVMVNLSQRITYTMRKEVFDHLTDLPVGFFDTHQTGEIVSRLSYDIDTLNASLSNDVLAICANSITVVGSFVMMLTISPVLISVFVITVPISLIFTKYKSTHIRPLFRARSAKLGELNGFAEEMLSGQKTIRTYGKEQVITDRFDVRNREACGAYYKADYHGSVIGPTVNFVSNLSIALITLLGSISICSRWAVRLPILCLSSDLAIWVRLCSTRVSLQGRSTSLPIFSASCRVHFPLRSACLASLIRHPNPRIRRTRSPWMPRDRSPWRT